MPLPDCTGVVLAGGTSRRFADGDKALATVAGVALVRRVVDSLGAATGDVVVAVRTADQRDAVGAALEGSPARITFVRDADGFEGPLAGVVAGTDRVGTPRFALVACDMPLLDPGVIEWLAGVDAGGSDAVVPVVDQPQPLQAVYRTRAVDTAVADLPRAGGMRSLLSELRVSRVPVSESPPGVDAARSLTNVNTVGDLVAVDDRSR